MSILVTESLGKLYGKRVGVARLDVHLAEGSLCGFLGPNGSGKSTTIRVLLGFLKPTTGRASIFGLDCWRQSRRIKKDVGYLPGDLRLYPWLTARLALELFSRIRRQDLVPAGLRLTEEFELDPDTRVSAMSRGMRQKLGIVLALAPEPRLLILDEPTASLDPIMQQRLKKHLRGMVSEGHTVFFSSHTLGEVERLCERVIILRKGRVVADASLDDLRARARREVVITWKKDAGVPSGESPPGLQISEWQGTRWRGTLTGPVDDLVRWLAGHPFSDLTVSPPDMETLFQSYYEEPQPCAGD